MSIIKSFVEELKYESTKTQKMLERVPLDKGSWKPHEKSMTLERLARHVAEMSEWATITVTEDELDFAKPITPNPEMQTTEELISFFKLKNEAAIVALEKTSDDELQKPWTLRRGEFIIFTQPKGKVLRDMVMNHIIHHRGQLSVYLRLLDVSVPGAYGPSADER